MTRTEAIKYLEEQHRVLNGVDGNAFDDGRDTGDETQNHSFALTRKKIDSIIGDFPGLDINGIDCEALWKASFPERFNGNDPLCLIMLGNNFINAVLREIKSHWYAVQKDEDDNEWDWGSYDLPEAKRMAKELGDKARIAIIDVNDDDPLCVGVIEADEI